LVDEMTAEGQTGAADEVDGDVIVLAVPYTEAPPPVPRPADRLPGRVLVDVTNPVDISVLEPLDVTPFRSGAAMIADVAPDGTRLVKAFNTTFAGTLLAGAVDGRPLHVFLAGDDDDAKQAVAALAPHSGTPAVD